MKKIILFLLVCLFLLRRDNIGKYFYNDIRLIEDADNYLVLVNKNNKLPSSYIPDDLVLISTLHSYDNKYVREMVAVNFEMLSYDASKLGFEIIAVSGYRSYEYQDSLFKFYVTEKGLEYALLCSAKPGHSEHQTGLAIDVMGSNGDYNLFGDSKEFNWMSSNAHKYGFILRYPSDGVLTTGFKYEPWHYRYVGKFAAKIMYDGDLTLEEYIKNSY